MLQCKRQNYHKSTLPAPGQIVNLPWTNEKAIVIAYPLCEGPTTPDGRRFYSFGIHSCILRILKNNAIRVFAGHYFTSND